MVILIDYTNLLYDDDAVCNQLKYRYDIDSQPIAFNILFLHFLDYCDLWFFVLNFDMEDIASVR